MGLLDSVKQFFDRFTSHGRRVGFWWSDNEPWFPHPKSFVDPKWGRVDREVVSLYLERGLTKDTYFGHSVCRFCGKENGCRDLTDGTYVWPEGYAHYLREHGVKPPIHFIEHVRSKLG